MKKQSYIGDGDDGLFKYLATGASRLWLILLCISVFALIGVAVTTSNTNNPALTNVSADAGGAGDASEILGDADTSESSVASSASNKINTSQLPDSSFIYDVSIEELSQADSYIDGQTVQVTGEVVGDRVFAEDDPDYCWITLQATDKSDAELVVYMPVSATRAIDTYGAYGRTGTELQVRGTFHLVCADHQGASEMHSENVAVVAKGAAEKVEFDVGRLIPGLLLIIVGCVLSLIYNILQERQK